MSDSKEQIRAVILATGNAHKVDEVRQILGITVPFLTLRDFPEAPSPEETGETFRENAAIKAVSLAAHVGNIVRNSRELPPALGRPEGPSEEAKRRFLQGVYVLGDDSGIEVRTLAWAPGVYSARFAALDTETPGNSSDTHNTAKLLRLLKDVPVEERQARFRCVIAVARVADVFEGAIHRSGSVRIDDGRESESDLDLNSGLNQRVRFFEGICPGQIALGMSGSGGFGYDPVFIADGTQATFAMISAEEKNRISHRARAIQLMAGTMGTA